MINMKFTNMLNIVIPMAGHGSRFSKVGYDIPKPLIPVKGIPMIQFVLNNLKPSIPHQFIIICQTEHLKKYPLLETIRKVSKDAKIIDINGVTDGALCTVLHAKNLIDNVYPLMIANCDQYIEQPIDNYINTFMNSGLDGFIMTMTATDPKWSYIEFDDHNKISSVIEKKVVSNEATVGIYNFLHGFEFVNMAHEMIKCNDKVNGEFYVAPVYNYFIKKGARIGFMNIGSERNGMYGLGVPDDLDFFNALTDFS
jgi:dTDP-glucose pyrophosphorylase